MNRRLHFLFSFLTLLVFSAGLRAQGVPCIGSVNISVDTSCSVAITPQSLQPPAGQGSTVVVKLSDWGLANTSTVAASVFPGATYNASKGTVSAATLIVEASNISTFFNTGMVGPYKISVDQSGVLCWGTVMIEDKLPPVLTIPDDVTVSCLYGPFNAYGNPRPVPGSIPDTATATGSCSKVNIYYVDKTEDVSCNPNSRVVKNITRIWTAINVKGAQTIDTQYITVEALDVSNLEAPTTPLEVSCIYKSNRSPAALLGKPYANGGDTVQKYDVYPYLQEGEDRSYLDKEAICNIGVLYTDVSVHACDPACEASIKVLRTWIVFDWCTGRDTQLTQVIKFVDNEAPTVAVGEPEKSYSVDAWECSTDIVLPAMVVADNCDEHASVKNVTTDAPIQVRYSASLKRWVAYDVPKGDHKFWITAADCCGNYVIDSVAVTVVDKVAPVATAKEFIVVSLTRSGLETGEKAVAKIKPEHIDNGSYDNCGPVYLEIRRDAGKACLNEGTSGYNNNLTYNGTVNGLDQANPIHLNDDTTDTDKGQFVKFCCEDAGKSHKVWLRVWDDASMDGIYGNAGDNYNETWAMVKVEDNTVPIIVVETDITIECDEDLAKLNLNLTSTKVSVNGKIDPAYLPWIDASCDYELFYTDRKVNITTCNTGTYERTYYVYGGKDGAVERTAKQTIYIENVQTDPYHDLPMPLHLWDECELTEDDVREFTKAAAYTYKDREGKTLTALYEMPYKWGKHDDGYNSPNLGNDCWNYDYLAYNGGYDEHQGLPETLGEVVTKLVDGGKFDLDWKDIGCRVFGKKIIIDEYEVGEGCKKWLVRFEYIDWCNPYWSYCLNTIYKYEDTTAPVIEKCVDLTIEVDQATCLGTATVSIIATDDGGCLAGYTWRVSVNGVTKTARGPKFSADFTGLPAGEHKVYVKVTDGCGNVAECVGNISVWPKDPTPYCIPLSSAVMKNGKVELWANDFDNGSFANCGNGLIVTTFDNEYPVASKIYETHYFKGEGQSATPEEYQAGNAQQWKPVVETTTWPNGDILKVLLKGSTSGKIFGCAVGDLIGTNEVIVTAWDTRYADFSVSDYCKTSLVLSNSQGDAACNGSGSANVTGRVATSVGEGVSGVEAQLSASLPEFPIMAVSAEGSFAFNNVPAGVEYEVSARKDVEYKNGVNTLDLLRIQRHILSMTKLDNAYKFVAADANNDQNIDVNDLVDLRKLVLGVINDLPRNQSWRFVDATQNFANISNPWPLSEVVVTKAGEAANFVAVKVGDIDINAAVSATSSTTTRSGDAVTFNINERSVKAGEVVEVAVTAENFNEVFGYQFTTELNGLTVEAVESGAITVDESMYANLGGKFTMSWTDVNGVSVSNDAVLFTLKVKATATTSLSEAIAMTSSVTEAEAYVGSDFATTDAKLNVRGAEAKGYALAQNEPNPFKAETVVRFSVPEASQVSFRVYDVTGKVLMNRFINAAKGDNAITLRKSDINASGIVYYQIESGDFTATKKMVIIE